MVKPVVHVYAPIRHPRLRYVLRVVGNDLGIRLRLLTDLQKWKKLDEYKVGYLENNRSGEFSRWFPASGFLSGYSVAEEDLIVSEVAGLPVFFPACSDHDLFACIFFALSRYEEYQTFAPDAHGRFPASASHAVANNYLHRPVVREWTAAIGRQLRSWFPELASAPASPPLTLRPTYDIDNLYAYHYRGCKGGANLIRDVLTGHFARARGRLTSTPETDHFNTLARLEELHVRHGLSPIYFWLLSSGRDRHDPNPYPIPAPQQSLMRELAARHDFGIHPSYRATTTPGLTARELERLTAIVERKAVRSRQHFLRFRFPGTPRELLAAGISHDYSMGYGDRIGWRAGTNLPFSWYDLALEKESRLTLVPFAAMDVTLKQYQGLGGGDAGAAVLRLAELVRPYGGDFYLLWHNSSFAQEFGWEGWREVYEDLVAELNRI